MEYSLKNASNRLNKLAVIISQVLHIDVEIADHRLYRIAGTGKLKNKINISMADEGHAYSLSLKTGAAQIIANPGSDPVCQTCKQRSVCKETFEISYPIKIDGNVVGIIGLLAYTKRQQQRIQRDLTSYCSFLEKISEFIAFDMIDLQSSRNQELCISILEDILDDVNLGIITADEENQMRLINIRAKTMLDLKPSDRKFVQITDLSRSSKGLDEYLLTIGERSYQVLGRYYKTHIKEHSSILLFSENRTVGGENKKTKARYPGAHRLDGKSQAVISLRRQIEELDYYKMNVLIVCEEGLEDRETALALHEESVMSSKKFFEFNCAAYREDEIKQLLFSPEGLLERAGGNCLFLRHVERLTAELQNMLLDTLETGQLPLPARNHRIKGVIRIISQSTEELVNLTEKGMFSASLYYYLSPAVIRIPPLRERGGDILMMAQNFLAQQKTQMIRPAKKLKLSDGFIQALLNYPWPGNIPQLHAAMDMAVVKMKPDRQPGPELLPGYVQRYLPKPVSQMPPTEEEIIIHGLRRLGKSVDGKRKLAEEMGISLTTLYRKIKKYSLDEAQKSI